MTDQRDDREADTRSDLEQAVDARSDAVARGEGGAPADDLDDAGRHDGAAGTGGVTRNQDLDQQ